MGVQFLYSSAAGVRLLKAVWDASLARVLGASPDSSWDTRIYSTLIEIATCQLPFEFPGYSTPLLIKFLGP